MSTPALEPTTAAVRGQAVRHRSGVAGLLALGLSLTLAACGGGDDGPSGTATATPSTGPSQTTPSRVPVTVTNTTPSLYQWDVLGVGRSTHIDSSETFTAVPGEYKGLKYLRTADADRFVGAANAVSFHVSRDVTVLIAFDSRSSSIPQWLANWADTGDSLATSSTTFRLYRKTFASGAVSLGGNELGGSTYAVVLDDGTALGNSPPTITGSPSMSISVNLSYEFAPSATDADGDRLLFSAANLPPWATLDATTGRLHGRPSTGEMGTYAGIVISVTDGDSTSTLSPFNITVSPPGTNSPPAISHSNVPTGTQYEPYAFQPQASDPDGDPLTFTINNKPRWATFDASTGRLEGTPGRGDAGTDPDILIHVTDGAATTTLPPFTIRIYAPGEYQSPTPSETNTTPAIGGTPATAALQGAAYSFTPWASDADGDTLIFSIANRPRWATFSSSGRLSGTPGAADVGTYTGILISVSDGQNVASLPPFSIDVNPAGSNVSPAINGVPVTSVTAGQAYEFTPTASDANGDTLTFSISARPSWASFDTRTGQLSGTPGTNHVGAYPNVTISVSDGQRTASLPPFSITVAAPAGTNRSPVISGAPPTHAAAGGLYSFRPSASDPDGDRITFAIANQPPWTTFDTSTGRLSGTPTAADVGTYANIVIRASDGQATATLAGFSITVVALATGSATLSWTPPTQNTDGSALVDLAGYRIYWGVDPGEYPQSMTLYNAGLTSYVVEQLTPGRWYFVATALNARGVESSFSSTASKLVQ